MLQHIADLKKSRVAGCSQPIQGSVTTSDMTSHPDQAETQVVDLGGVAEVLVDPNNSQVNAHSGWETTLKTADPTDVLGSADMESKGALMVEDPNSFQGHYGEDDEECYS